MVSSQRKRVDFPDKFKPFFQPRRYKVAYGGRGSGKSWSIARALLILAASKPLRVLCARELQRSIKDSVHKLLCDQIDDLGLTGFYTVTQTSIKGRNGSEFGFCGLRHNATEIKSYEGADIAWVEEAQVVSKTSWQLLIPTIRKPGSEIWISFNPELEEDETYQRFVTHPPPDSLVVKMNWSDNPWFPDVLRGEKDYLRSKSEDDYLTIWEGHCRQCLEGAIYAKELRDAQAEGRICRIPIDASKPVDTFWDLGWADNTSIWFAQTVGKEIRVVDFLQDHLKPIQHYVQQLQAKGYVYGKDFLPHDARAKQLGTGKSIEEVLRSLGRNVHIVPRLSVKDGINAARTIFPSVWIDEERCADGLQALRRYRYDLDPNTGQFSRDPLHDEHSHAADAWRYFAVGYRKPVDKQPRRPKQSGGWMGL